MGGSHETSLDIRTCTPTIRAVDRLRIWAYYHFNSTADFTGRQLKCSAYRDIDDEGARWVPSLWQVAHHLCGINGGRLFVCSIHALITHLIDSTNITG